MRALKAQLRLRERRATPFVGQGNAGREPPVELRPLPVMMGKAGQGSGKPLKGGVAHED
ncbi:MAG: hypothetical protein RXO22_01865 [Thermocladium sp.]